jgi:putative endonuclease
VNKPNGQKQAQSTTKQKGDAAKDRALQHLQTQGLQLVQRNYRTPGRGGGEIDLVMRESDGTLVFDEVRNAATPSMAGLWPASLLSNNDTLCLLRVTIC